MIALAILALLVLATFSVLVPITLFGPIALAMSTLFLLIKLIKYSPNKPLTEKYLTTEEFIEYKASQASTIKQMQDNIKQMQDEIENFKLVSNLVSGLNGTVDRIIALRKRVETVERLLGIHK